jgi:hypothetical protein
MTGDGGESNEQSVVFPVGREKAEDGLPPVRTRGTRGCDQGYSRDTMTYLFEVAMTGEVKDNQRGGNASP